MSKTFRENYYEDGDFGTKNFNKSNRRNRQKIKNYLRKVDFGNIDDENEFDINDDLEKIE